MIHKSCIVTTLIEVPKHGLLSKTTNSANPAFAKHVYQDFLGRDMGLSRVFIVNARVV